MSLLHKTRLSFPTSHAFRVASVVFHSWFYLSFQITERPTPPSAVAPRAMADKSAPLPRRGTELDPLLGGVRDPSLRPSSAGALRLGESGFAKGEAGGGYFARIHGPI